MQLPINTCLTCTHWWPQKCFSNLTRPTEVQYHHHKSKWAGLQTDLHVFRLLLISQVVHFVGLATHQSFYWHALLTHCLTAIIDKTRWMKCCWRNYECGLQVPEPWLPTRSDGWAMVDEGPATILTTKKEESSDRMHFREELGFCKSRKRRRVQS